MYPTNTDPQKFQPTARQNETPLIGEANKAFLAASRIGSFSTRPEDPAGKIIPVVTNVSAIVNKMNLSINSANQRFAPQIAKPSQPFKVPQGYQPFKP